MKAYLRSARIAPKKANLVAKMVRGMTVPSAIEALEHTHKKGARLIEKLLKSAVANAEHNEKQSRNSLVIKTIVVNQGTAYRRGVPKARGSVRPIQKFLSHISLTLGIAEDAIEKSPRSPKKPKSPTSETKKGAKSASQKAKSPVKNDSSTPENSGAPASSDSLVSSDSSVSSS